MKKIFILFFAGILFILSLFGCGKFNNSTSYNGRSPISIEVVKYKYITDGGSMKPHQDKIWKLTDRETIDKFLAALENKVKSTGILDMRPRDYYVKISYSDKSIDEYDLWLDDDPNIRGTLMKGSDAWFIDAKSSMALKEILK